MSPMPADKTSGANVAMIQYDISPGMATTFSRSQLRDSAAAHIRELIVAGLARPGELLRLAPLAERVSTSITPIREALLLLAQDGWVVQEPNRGFRVAPIRQSDVEDAYFVHALTAGELAARAAARIAPAEIETLRALDAEIQALGAGERHAELERLNYELHNVTYEAAESPRLVWFVTAASRFVPRRYWATIGGWTEMNRVEHGPIIDAIAAGDSDTARDLMARHVTHASELLISHLNAIHFWD
jgi:DNA-binding GntR family transcriptional regulator